MAFDLDGVRDNLRANIEDAAWHDLAMRCISCGTCTYVCPNCYCFTITDEMVETQRRTLSAPGTTASTPSTRWRPRATTRATHKSNRFRNRFSHKFWYYPDKYDSLLCSGCGRCILHCPTRIDIREVLRVMGSPRVPAATGEEPLDGRRDTGAATAATSTATARARPASPPPTSVAGATTARAGTRAGNPYLPEIATVVEIMQETPNIKSFRVRFDDQEVMNAFSFEPGQVGQLGVFGVGEATFAINSSPSEKDYVQFSVMQAGEVTTALHDLSVGDKVGVRAPMGCGFPVDAWKGKSILYIMGGIGSAALRATINYTLEHRADYENITILYGARTPQNFTYKYDIEDWEARDDIDSVITVDREFAGWECDVGFVPAVLEEMAPKPANTIAITCGPPIMIKFVLQSLQKLQFADDQIYTTLEKRMKCGIGICGRCNIGPKYVCVDGPVFSMAELRELPDEM